jgi:hypothetical protein
VQTTVLEVLHAGTRILVTRYLPGRLVLGSDHEDDPATYRQAGELLALFHGQASGTACWSYRLGIESFEAQGHRMIAEALAAE